MIAVREDGRFLDDAMGAYAPYWSEIADWTLQGDRALTDEVVAWGQDLAGQVTAGTITLKELQIGTGFAKALDGDTYERASSDITLLEGADLIEGTARRLAHHAGMHALDLLTAAKQGQAVTGPMPGMGGLNERSRDQG